MRKRICDHAIDVLIATDNPAVMWGDTGLLHMIASAAGIKSEGPKTPPRILAALSKTPGRLVKGLTANPSKWGPPNVLIFRLPPQTTENEP